MDALHKDPMNDKLKEAWASLDRAYSEIGDAMTAIAEAEQAKPMAWIPAWAHDLLTGKMTDPSNPVTWGIYTHLYAKNTMDAIPVYTHPPKSCQCAGCGKQSSEGWALYCVECGEIAHKRKPLTDEQLRDALRSCPHDAREALRVCWLYAKDFARAIEQAHGIKSK